MEELKRIVQKIREGKLKKLMAELTWMYVYVRRYWLLIVLYILLGASGSLLGLGTSMVSRNLVDAVTGVNSQRVLEVASIYVGVGVSQIFINAVKMRLSLRIRLKVTNEIRADIYEQVLNTDWASLAKYRSGDLLYRVNGDAGMVANNISPSAQRRQRLHQLCGRLCRRHAERSGHGADRPGGGAGFAGHVPLPGEADQGFPEG